MLIFAFFLCCVVIYPSTLESSSHHLDKRPVIKHARNDPELKQVVIQIGVLHPAFRRDRMGASNNLCFSSRKCRQRLFPECERQ